METAALGSVGLKEKAGAGLSTEENLKKKKKDLRSSIFMTKCVKRKKKKKKRFITFHLDLI